MPIAARIGIVWGLLTGVLPLAVAQDPFTLSLLTQNTLDGWDYGAQPLVGWTNSDGRLSGDYRATPLVAGWTLGEQFDLSFRWSAPSGGVIHLAFPNLSGGGRLDLRIAEGDSCGALFYDNKLLTAGGNVPPSETGHQATLRRQAGVWQLFVDGRSIAQAEVPAHARLGIQLSVSEGAASLEDLRLDEPVGAPLFNGVDLNGWWTPRNPKSWPVVDGEITCINRSGDYLRSEQEYANFTFSCEYKMRRGGNSGIGIRTSRNAWPSGDGIELQLLDEPLHAPLTRSSTMGLYGNVGPLARADRSEEWNRLVIKTEGYLVSAWVNGVLVQHVNLARMPELKYRPLSGWIGFQDHQAWIRVRNVNLLPGPEGEGPAVWYARRSEDASQLVLERLLNSERLTVADGTRSHHATIAVADREEQVLADLTGRGAVVQIEATDPTGQLGFYFNGESEPRIDCPVRELARHLPDVANRGGSCASFVGYEKSLKVVLRGGKRGEYRIAHVDFGPGTPVQTFRDREESIARGMLPTISYRMHQMESGRVRDDDPMPRKLASPQRIEPGSSVPLVQLDGAGTVQWWRLNAPAKALENDDLWIEVTIDGESEPAIAAPARYLFPGLKAGRGYLNFAVTNYQGFVNRLAMPYANGLSIVATNRGSEPLQSIGCAVSYQPQPNASEMAKRLRLRGQWRQGGGDSPAVFNQAGQGRLVWLVCEQPASASSTVDLVLDGAASGAQPASLAGWLNLPPGTEDVRTQFCGRQGGLIWRHYLLAPVEFNRSLELRATEGEIAGGRLAMFYLAP